MIRGIIIIASTVAFAGYLIHERYLMVILCMAIVELAAITKE